MTYHVRRSALPRPGTSEQLRDLVARIMSRPLDRNRPLWEMYLVEGLEHGRFAILTKTHHAMVDGVTRWTSDRSSSTSAGAAGDPRLTWRPTSEPSGLELVAGAVSDLVRRPTAAVDAVRSAPATCGGPRAGRPERWASRWRRAPWPGRPGQPVERRDRGRPALRPAETDLDDYKAIRKSHGGTVNDVVLTALAGALREWLLTRGEASAAHGRAGHGPGQRAHPRRTPRQPDVVFLWTCRSGSPAR